MKKVKVDKEYNPIFHIDGMLLTRCGDQVIVISKTDCIYGVLVDSSGDKLENTWDIHTGKSNCGNNDLDLLTLNDYINEKAKEVSQNLIDDLESKFESRLNKLEYNYEKIIYELKSDIRSLENSRSYGGGRDNY
jgi:hypothetical protein